MKPAPGAVWQARRNDDASAAPSAAAASTPVPRAQITSALLHLAVLSLATLICAATAWADTGATPSGMPGPEIATSPNAPESTGRTAIRLSDAEHHDWRAIGRINRAGHRSQGLCTGTLVASDLVLTAAHCVTSPVTGRPHAPGEIQFLAGWLRGSYAAHRSAVEVIFPQTALPRSEVPQNGAADTVPAPAGDGPDGTLSGDIALVRLGRAIPAEHITPLPLGPLVRAAVPVSIIAYSRDLPNAMARIEVCGPGALDGAVLGLTCPVTSGNSGAPVLGRIGGTWHVVAVVTARLRGDRAIKALAVVPGAAVTEYLLPR